MVALQIEQQYGPKGAAYIQGRLRHFEERNEVAAVSLWREIEGRFEALNPSGAKIAVLHGTNSKHRVLPNNRRLALLILNPAMILALAALISAVSTMVWALRRKP